MWSRKRAWWRTVTLRTDRRSSIGFNGCICSERSFELFSWTAERKWTFLNSESTIIRVDVSVSASPILSINNSVCSYRIVFVRFRNSKTVKWPCRLRNISTSRFKLLSRSMAYSKSPVIVSNILIPIVTTLPEFFLKSIAFIKENWFEMTWTMHSDCCYSLIMKVLMKSATVSLFLKINYD